MSSITTTSTTATVVLRGGNTPRSSDLDLDLSIPLQIVEASPPPSPLSPASSRSPSPLPAYALASSAPSSLALRLLPTSAAKKAFRPLPPPTPAAPQVWLDDHDYIYPNPPHGEMSVSSGVTTATMCPAATTSTTAVLTAATASTTSDVVQDGTLLPTRTVHAGPRIEPGQILLPARQIVIVQHQPTGQLKVAQQQQPQCATAHLQQSAPRASLSVIISKRVAATNAVGYSPAASAAAPAPTTNRNSQPASSLPTSLSSTTEKTAVDCHLVGVKGAKFTVSSEQTVKTAATSVPEPKITALCQLSGSKPFQEGPLTVSASVNNRTVKSAHETQDTKGAYEVSEVVTKIVDTVVALEYCRDVAARNAAHIDASTGEKFVIDNTIFDFRY